MAVVPETRDLFLWRSKGRRDGPGCRWCGGESAWSKVGVAEEELLKVRPAGRVVVLEAAGKGGELGNVASGFAAMALPAAGRGAKANGSQPGGAAIFSELCVAARAGSQGLGFELTHPQAAGHLENV